MIGLCFFGNLIKNYSWELQLFAITRKISDGFTFFSFKINFDFFKFEHNPSFHIEFIICNIYNHLMIYKNSKENIYGK